MLISLNKNQSRPVFYILGSSNLALLDTGAEFPVWTGAKYTLIYQYKAVKVKVNVRFKGFGGVAVGDLYKVPIFKLGELIYPNLSVVLVENSNQHIQMILSASMFNKLIYEINDKYKYFKVTVPQEESNVRHLEVYDSNGRLHILCNN